MAGVDVVKELEESGVEATVTGTGYAKILCPFHDDHNPSLSVSLSTGRFNCNVPSCSGNRGGDVFDLFAGIKKKPRNAVITEFKKVYSLDDRGYIDPSTVERFADNLHSDNSKAKALKQQLRMRGLTDETLREYSVGEKDGAITIPVKDKFGGIINVRYYYPGAPSADKMKNSKGRSEAMLFPNAQLAYPDLVLTGGEVKALAGLQHLNKINVGVFCVTNGEGAWIRGLEKFLKGKTVTLALDIDEAGETAAKQYAQKLLAEGVQVRKIDFGLDPNKYPSRHFVRGVNFYDFVTDYNRRLHHPISTVGLYL